MTSASDPILIEVTRGERVESTHRGAVAVFDADGHSVLTLGDIECPVFPRSAVKVIQALPLIETGAADRWLFDEPELALACASHSGEPEHVALAQSMLERIGLAEPDLECGVQWPSQQPVALALARSGRSPTQLHNNCSGKHSGFLSVCQHCGIDHHGYVGAEHPFQEMVRIAMQEVTGYALEPDNRGIDGCSIPTYAVPLSNLAKAFARLGAGVGLEPERAKAARRLIGANMAHPFLVSGTDRADLKLMEAAPGRVFAKGGAEGVHCGAIPELGLGIAIKCDDGAGRASDAAMAAVFAGMLRAEPELAAAYDQLARPELRNWRGTLVGNLQPAVALR